ncbi:helix-turn-helix domain-containing protein [Polyangium jinanense]|uniref:Helix-turn-helix transcriptional regulator n=1 Tax=Polyangium jinanense TaxID=2829994 RepID=A0A9X3X778_9BACT|nr:helix-turn-helix transcriptional regulator [Polyangium jinanense]MDC3959037.1 helix-turn-helix transcriptional regulator [Polyangium jinanense]MDC3984040.1 helix-turn-helix transcriptional regulator [Polyangium jinanense]
MVRFDAPDGARFATSCPGEGWGSVGWTRLDAWRGATGYRELAARLGCSPGLLTGWKQGRTPAAPYLEKLEALADIPPIAWSWWTRTGAGKAAPSDAPRTEAEAPPPSDPPHDAPPVLGTTAEELRASVARLTKILQTGKLSPAQIATLEGKRITALTALAKLEQAASIENHPEWPGVMADLVDAVFDAIDAAGVVVKAEIGIGALIADRFEALQAKRHGREPRRNAA